MLHSEQAAAAELQRSAPVPVPNGGSVNSAVDTAALAEAALPWQQRRLRQLFPSFRGSLKERGPMAVMQVCCMAGVQHVQLILSCNYHLVWCLAA